MAIKLYLTVALICIFLIVRENEQLFNFYCLYWFSSSVLPMCIFANFDHFAVVWILLINLRIKGWFLKTHCTWLWYILSIYMYKYHYAYYFSQRGVYGSSEVTDNTSMNTGEVDVFSLFSRPGRLGRGSQVEEKLRGNCKM